ncbi:MAG: fructose-bisphosphate aldolase class I [Thermoleophilaceae bacterium]|nr:fructose-bisphosphate aldolase class I [Thermoleophilaceae bacterium]
MTDRREELEATARAMVADGEGILAADESNATMTKRLEGVEVESTEDSRLAFRELLTATPDAGKAISGVILYDETIKQKTSEGTPFPDFLTDRGMIPGIKVDTGAKDLAGAPGEKVTEGLDGLRERLAEYYELGARFAKWRGVITLGDHLPTDYCVRVNAQALARYAALCQEAGIAPIVEPEVLMDGEHTVDRSEQVTLNVLSTVFAELRAQRVLLEGMVLKPNMVLSGYDCSDQADVQEVAERTLETLRRTVPAAVAGIAFLSGGQSDERATAHLNAMSAMGPHPWALTFSYGRALQAAPLKAWGGQEGNAESARAAFALRARCNSAATQGRYSEEMEKEPVA